MSTLCILPFIHFNVLANGQASVCCVSNDPLPGEDGKPLNVRSNSLNEIWNSAALRNVRAKMLANEKPSQCECCYKYEALYGGGSHRTGQNSLFLVDRDADIAPTNDWVRFPQVGRDQLNLDMAKPIYFDLRFDNLCNLKCVICFAYASSRIERDPVHIAWTGEQAIERIPNRFGNATRWVKSEILFDEIKEIGSEVRYIQMAGGEPFMSELALKWMKYLGETGRAEFVTLKVFTNLHTFDDNIIELLAPFRFIDMTLSIDGTEDIYEFVRYPGKWNKVRENARRLIEERDRGRLKRMTVNINATMSALSASHILNVFDFAKEHGFGATLSNAMEPPHVSTKYLPTRTKDRLERDLRAFEKINRNTFPHLAGHIDQWMPELRSVDIRMPKHADAVRRVMQFVNDMDVSRGLSFQTAAPQVYADFIEEFGCWDTTVRFASPAETPPSDPVPQNLVPPSLFERLRSRLRIK